MHKYTAELTWKKILFDKIIANAKVWYQKHLVRSAVTGRQLGFTILPKTLALRRTGRQSLLLCVRGQWVWFLSHV